MDETVTSSAEEASISSTSRPFPELNALMREMDALATAARGILSDLSRPWKGDLSSRAGWHHLQEAIYSEPFTNRLSPEAIEKLKRSCTAWHHRYKQLRFITATRPVSNT